MALEIIPNKLVPNKSLNNQSTLPVTKEIKNKGQSKAKHKGKGGWDF